MAIYSYDRAASMEEVLRVLDEDVAEWFKQFKELTPPQKYGIIPISQGKNVLITSPTGSGKTLTAFLYILSELFKLAKQGKLEDTVYAVYVSPLRALNNDIRKNLEKPLREITEMIRRKGVEIQEIRIAVRTGDTTASERSRMLRKPPHILITTPESLALVITAPLFREKLKGVRWVIVDEIHSLCENKRGAHLSLTLERLQEIVGRPFVRIGLSATISPLEEVAKFLVGYNDDGTVRDCYVIDARFSKPMDLRLICPVEDLIYTPAEEASEAMYRRIAEIVNRHRTTLIFTNTRSGTERVVFHLKRLGLVDADKLGAHHSSLSREERFEIEDRLKRGEVKGVVTSTSLELGIDIGYIDAVVQIGSPKGISRGLQRVGRSGHSMDKTSRGYFIALDLDDLIEDGVLIREAYRGRLDNVSIPKNPLDVLAQHIVGMALTRKWRIEEAYRLVRRSYCFHDLPWEDFIAVLRYLAGRYQELVDRKVYAKIWLDEEEGVFGRRGKLLRPIYFQNIGTIPDEVAVTVYHGARRVGYLEEEFLEELSPGDTFILGGKVYRFKWARGLVAFVEPAEGAKPTVPRWISELLPLTFDLGEAIADFRYMLYRLIREGRVREAEEVVKREMRADDSAARNVTRYIAMQYRYLRSLGFDDFHSRSNLIVERFRMPGEPGIYYVFHTVFGRRVNSVLARAIAHVIGREEGINVRVIIDDHGFALHLPYPVDIERYLRMVNSRNLRKEISEAVLNTQYIWRIFRHVATRALMVLRYYKGKKTRVHRQQLNSEMLFSVVREMRDFPLLKEAIREVIEDKMDVVRAEIVLRDVEEGRRRWVVLPESDIPSPFAQGPVLRGMKDAVLMSDRVRLMQRLYEALKRRLEGGAGAVRGGRERVRERPVST
ncbi:ATP-dependent helicase [Candidatus Geothermarchaeota archaeon ex4572_27]|nr:MAG: ATP-dependent helicase [Candidatus Geothermarchaeota archaeon ex4572_27]